METIVREAAELGLRFAGGITWTRASLIGGALRHPSARVGQLQRAVAADPVTLATYLREHPDHALAQLPVIP
jgi:hypothetical protein